MAITVEGNKNILKLYSNGEKIGETIKSSVQNPHKYVKVLLGNDLVPPSPSCEIFHSERSFIGEIGQFFMWSKVLNVDDIRYIYNNIYKDKDFLVGWADFTAVGDVTMGCHDDIGSCKWEK